MSRRIASEDAEDFWPAYADILMVSVLVLVFIVAAISLNAMKEGAVTSEIEDRKAVFKTAFDRSLGSLSKKGQVKLEEPEHAERQVITFSDKLLFAVGDARITNPEGRMALAQVSRLIRQHSSPQQLFARVQVNGHTDEDPIWTPLYHSNWELSSARATSVVTFLAGYGVKPALMSATGFAEYRPYDAFDKLIKDKARKRRIEIEIHYPADWVLKQAPWQELKGAGKPASVAHKR